MAARVRLAAPDDIPAIRGVLITTWHATYDALFGRDRVEQLTALWHDAGLLRAQLDQPGTLMLVAEDARGRLAGTLFATRRAGDEVVLNRLYVLPEAQGQGLGSALFAELVARFAPSRLISLEVEPRNTPALDFYRKLGFAEAGRDNACGGDTRNAIDHLILHKTM